jgi:acetyl-CoA carboxylase biotin carboxylase subunit
MLGIPAGPGIRIDSGVYEGWTVPIDYDPLLAKLIGHGENRAQAISRLARALEEFFVSGIKTNVALFRRILADGDFLAGKIDTGYLERLLASGSVAGKNAKKNERADIAAIAAAVFAMLDSASKVTNESGTEDTGANASNWKRTARTEGLM